MARVQCWVRKIIGIILTSRSYHVEMGHDLDTSHISGLRIYNECWLGMNSKREEKSIGSKMNHNIYLRYVIFLSCLIRVSSIANVASESKFMFKTPAAIRFFSGTVSNTEIVTKNSRSSSIPWRRPHSILEHISLLSALIAITCTWAGNLINLYRICDTGYVPQAFFLLSSRKTRKKSLISRQMNLMRFLF